MWWRGPLAIQHTLSSGVVSWLIYLYMYIYTIYGIQCAWIRNARHATFHFVYIAVLLLAWELRDILPLNYTLDIEHGQGKLLQTEWGSVWPGGESSPDGMHAAFLLNEVSLKKKEAKCLVREHNMATCNYGWRLGVWRIIRFMVVAMILLYKRKQ